MTPIDDGSVDENTSGLEDSRRALADARQSSRRADVLIASSRKTLSEAHAVRESNHFTDKFRAIIRGAA